ncbi:MAG: PAS domain-containing protein [Anaerolineae bacterium]|nr:PAS domain-containing protein [Anaerolineae bacterium]
MFSLQLAVSLVKNVSLILSLVFIFGLLVPSLRHRRASTQAVIYGVLYGLLGVMLMLSPTEVGPGFFVDGRSIIITIAGAFGGLIPALITTVMMSTARWLLGGEGAIGGIGAIVILASVGCAVHLYHHRRGILIARRTLVILSAVATAVPLITLWIVAGREVALMSAVPYLAVVPLGMILFGYLLLRQKHQFDIEEALQESEERYRSVVDAMTEGVIVRNAAGVVQAANLSALRVLDVSMEEMQSRAVDDPRWGIICEDGSPFPMDHAPSMTALRTGKPQFGQVLGFQKAGGSVTWLLMNAQPLFKAGNTQPYAVVVTFTDVTELKSAHQSLIQERDLLRTLIDSTPDYIFIKDSSGRFILSNEAHAHAVHVSADALVGKTAFDVFPEGLAAQFHADDLATMQSGEPQFNLERTTLGDQGNLKTVLTTKVPLHGRDGRVIGLVGMSRDITDRKLVEQQSLELVAERERVHVLRRFLADMSHDFRTPLAVVNTSLYLLQKSTDPQRQADQIEKIESQVQRMEQLLGELLDMDRLDRENPEPVFVPVAINTMVAELVRNLEAAAEENHHTLAIDLNHEVPPIMGNAAQLQQALEHILQNAVDYTPTGGAVTVRTSVQHNHVLIAVEDTGIGIGPDDLPHIFERFYRADQARSADSGGSGLGLSIARKVIEAHGGDIVVSSTPGKGSVFVIRLPIQATSTDHDTTAVVRSVG